MGNTYSITEAQAKFPSVVKEAVDGPVAITRRDKTVGYIISKDRMDGILETLELLASPEAMRAIRDYEAGRMKLLPVEALDEDA